MPKCAWLCYTELLTLWKTTKPKTVSLLRDLSRTRQNYKMGPLWHLILLLINYRERGKKKGILPFPISKITELPRVLLISSSSHFKTLSHVTFICLLRSSEGGTQPNFVLVSCAYWVYFKIQAKLIEILIVESYLTALKIFFADICSRIFPGLLWHSLIPSICKVL